MLFKFRKKYKDYEIQPDEIFLDTLNVSGLDQQQFEGVIEQPIKKSTLVIVAGLFLCVIVFFSLRLMQLQILQGEKFSSYSENNRLRKEHLFAERGVIYDRNGIEIAWNNQGKDQSAFLYRAYTSLSGHGHLLGYVEYPQTDSSGNFWRTEISGLAGLEKKYNTLLTGVNGTRLREMDAFGNLLSENVINAGEAGKNLYTTVDTHIQHYLYEAIAQQADEADFVGGAGSIMNISNGELLAFTSYPEFDPYTLAEGSNVAAINGFFSDPGKPFLNRVLSGLYTPGSIVKPFLGIAALNEGLITKDTKILSTGSIEVPNRFNPSNSSFFKDWRDGGHGSTDIRHAIADSVNTFFYAIGGGWKGQEGLGIAGIEKYISAFDITEPTGIDFGREVLGTIPTPEWKERLFSDGDWRLGDTYNTSIGQFGFQVTPIQMTRATAALANNGILQQPLLVKSPAISKKISEDIPLEYYELIRTAMRDTVTIGTARVINVPYIDSAAKTGTAQVGVNNEYYNSWIIGFFPYEKPQYAFSIVMERAPRGGEGSAGRAMRNFLENVQENYPEFWEETGYNSLAI